MIIFCMYCFILSIQGVFSLMNTVKNYMTFQTKPTWELVNVSLSKLTWSSTSFTWFWVILMVPLDMLPVILNSGNSPAVYRGNIPNEVKTDTKTNILFIQEKYLKKLKILFLKKTSKIILYLMSTLKYQFSTRLGYNLTPVR